MNQTFCNFSTKKTPILTLLAGRIVTVGIYDQSKVFQNKAFRVTLTCVYFANGTQSDSLNDTGFLSDSKYMDFMYHRFTDSLSGKRSTTDENTPVCWKMTGSKHIPVKPVFILQLSISSSFAIGRSYFSRAIAFRTTPSRWSDTFKTYSRLIIIATVFHL